ELVARFGEQGERCMQLPGAAIAEHSARVQLGEALQRADTLAIAAAQKREGEIGAGFIDRRDGIRLGSEPTVARREPRKDEVHVLRPHLAVAQLPNHALVDRLLGLDKAMEIEFVVHWKHPDHPAQPSTMSAYSGCLA